MPIEVLITRPDIVYRNTTTGAITASPVIVSGVTQTVPIINVPGGGNSRNSFETAGRLTPGGYPACFPK